MIIETPKTPKRPKYTKKQRKEINKKIGLGVSKFSDETVRKLEDAFLMDCTVEEACLNADITQDTYYRWIKENPKLSERFERLRNNPYLIARKTIIEGIKENPELALKYMERKKKNEFSTKSEMDVNNNITVVDETIKKINDLLDEKSE
jgi:hypothetical protein